MNKYKCPHCNTASTSVLWNEATAFETNTLYKNIPPIQVHQSGFYVCPECKKQVLRTDIEEVSEYEKFYLATGKKIKTYMKTVYDLMRYFDIATYKSGKKSDTDLVFVPTKTFNNDNVTITFSNRRTPRDIKVIAGHLVNKEGTLFILTIQIRSDRKEPRIRWVNSTDGDEYSNLTEWIHFYKVRNATPKKEKILSEKCSRCNKVSECYTKEYIMSWC